MFFLKLFRVSNIFIKRLLLFDSAEIKMATKYLSSKSDSLDYFRKSTKFKPVTHVIFDMDGLLLNTEVIYKKIITEIVQLYGKEYTNEIQLKVLGTTEQLTAKIVVEECHLPLTIDEFIKEFRQRQTSQLGNAKLKEGAERLVRHLHESNIPIAVATSSGQKSVDIKTKNHKSLFQLFSHIVMGSSDPEVKEGKPAPDIFIVCANRFKNKPEYEKCLVFEDAPNGVTGAVKAGMQTVMVPETVLPPEKTAHSTLVINSLLNFNPEDFGLPPFETSINN